MNLAFSPKFLADVRNQAQVLLYRSCMLGKVVNTHTKGFTLLGMGKDSNCNSCVLITALSISTIFVCEIATILSVNEKLPVLRFRYFG